MTSHMPFLISRFLFGHYIVYEAPTDIIKDESGAPIRGLDGKCQVSRAKKRYSMKYSERHIQY